MNRFFETLTEEISKGLPGVTGDENESDEEEDNFALTDWTCPYCKVINKSNSEKCVECKGKRPVYKSILKSNKDPNIAAKKLAK